MWFTSILGYQGFGDQVTGYQHFRISGFWDQLMGYQGFRISGFGDHVMGLTAL